MSQQEFAPQPQSQQSQELQTEGQHSLSDNEIYYPQHPYYWSKGEAKAGLPRDEPPSSYDEPAMQHGYQAQGGYAGETQHTERAPGSRPGLRQQFSPDGDAYEQGYRVYNRYNAWRTVPPWARPQSQRKSAVRLALLIVLGLLLIKPILILMGLLLAVIGLTIFAIVLPVIFAVGIVSIILIALRVAFWQRRIPYRQHYSRVWRGPWGW
jgi:hypothetical protein